MSLTESKKGLVYNIIDFLRTSTTNSTVSESNIESLEVAIQCLSESFDVDLDSAQDKEKYGISGGKGLESVWDVYLKTRAKSGTSAAGGAGGGAKEKENVKEEKETVKEEENSSTKKPSDEDKKAAEALKAEGNALHTKKLYSLAIAKYTSAISLHPTNPVYWSNRSAAYSAEGDYENAKKDAKRSVEVDEGFGRGWSRLGHAEYALGNFTASIAAYTKGLTLDPTSTTMKTALAQAKVKAKECGQSTDPSDANKSTKKGQEDDDDDDEDEDEDEQGGVTSARGPGSAGGMGGMGGMPDLSALAGMFGGGGGGGGGAGGMPDLASLMQNPAMMQMAQNMMANGGLDRMMENPAIRSMAERMQGGGGMPDMAALANDPAMRDMAQQFMGGMGRGQGR